MVVVTPRRRLLALSLLVVITACSSSPATEPTPPVITEDPARQETVLPTQALLASLEVSLTALLAGAPPQDHLVGDRLMILTTDTFSEIHDTGSDGFLDATFSLGGGCGSGPCLMTAREFLVALSSDVATGAGAEAPTAVPGSLVSWSSVVVGGPSRVWRVHLSADASGLVAVEYFGPVPLGAATE